MHLNIHNCPKRQKPYGNYLPIEYNFCYCVESFISFWNIYMQKKKIMDMKVFQNFLFYVNFFGVNKVNFHFYFVEDNLLQI